MLGQFRNAPTESLSCSLGCLACALLLVCASPSHAEWAEGVDWKVVFPEVENELCPDPDGPGFIPRIFELMRDVEVDLSEAIELSELPATRDPSGGVIYRNDQVTWTNSMLDRLDEWAAEDIDTHTLLYRLYNTLVDDDPSPRRGVVLQLKRGFRWDGPSIPAIVLCNPAGWRTELMRASAVHDALYDWMRLYIIPEGPQGTEGWLNRLIADTLIYVLSRDDGAPESRSELEWATLRVVGRLGIDDRDIDCPRRHARAALPSTVRASCLVPGEAASIVLDGADYGLWGAAGEWEWEDGGAINVRETFVLDEEFFPAGSPYAITAKVSDGDDEACSPKKELGTYDLRDSTVVTVEVEADTQAPTLVPKLGPISIPAAQGVFATLTIDDFVQTSSDDCNLVDVSIASVTPELPSSDWIIAPDGQSVQVLSDVGKEYLVEVGATDEAGNERAVSVAVAAEVTPGDLNFDGGVDCLDLDIPILSFGRYSDHPAFDPRADVDQSGLVDVRDLVFVARNLPARTICP